MLAWEDRDEIEPRLRLSRAEHETVMTLRAGFGLNAGEIADRLNPDTSITLRVQQVSAIIYPQKEF